MCQTLAYAKPETILKGVPSTENCCVMLHVLSLSAARFYTHDFFYPYGVGRDRHRIVQLLAECDSFAWTPQLLQVCMSLASLFACFGLMNITLSMFASGHHTAGPQAVLQTDVASLSMSSLNQTSLTPKATACSLTILQMITSTIK